MEAIDTALARLETAVDALAQSVETVQAREAASTATSSAGARTAPAADSDVVARLTEERDALAREVSLLRKQAIEDKQLRADAATAVREALSGLRGAVAAQTGSANE